MMLPGTILIKSAWASLAVVEIAVNPCGLAVVLSGLGSAAVLFAAKITLLRIAQRLGHGNMQPALLATHHRLIRTLSAGVLLAFTADLAIPAAQQPNPNDY